MDPHCATDDARTGPPTPPGLAPPPVDRRSAILTTARRLWGQHGYRGVSLRRIADEAGVTLSLIDHHFGAKPMLFAQAIGLATERCKLASQELERTPTPSEEALTAQIARALAEPVWQAHQCPAGRDSLALWMRHRYETLPEVRLPLDRAVEPLLHAVAEIVCRQRPGCARPRVEAVCYRVLDNGVELLATYEQLRGPRATRLDEHSPVDLDDMLTQVSTWLRFGLADPA